MKNYFIICICLSVLVTACKGDDDVSSSFNKNDGKQALEDNTIEVLEAIQNFRDDSSLIEVEEFLNVINSGFEEENIITEQAKVALAFTEQVNDLSDNIISIDMYEEPIYFEEEMTLEEEYNDLLGVHTWNISTGEFDHTNSGDNNIVISVTSNNKTATLTISNFSTLFNTEGEELPKSINTELKIDDRDIMAMNHSLELDDNNELPSSVVQSVTFGTMSYALNLSVSDDKISFVESMSIDNLNILSVNSEINGSLDEVEQVVSLSTNSSVSLGKTSISFKGETPDTIDEEIFQEEEEIIDLLNESVSISISADNKKVADGEFFSDTNNELNVRMIFEDGSKADLEAYFIEGFEDIKKHIENTIEAYSN